MYKKPLIISDNPSLCSGFVRIAKEKLPSIPFKIGVSPFSNVSDFEQNVEVIDMKEQFHVEHIINEYDIVFSIHCKQIFPDLLVKTLKCVNVHPGYNPINRGWYPQVFAIINDLSIGATIHEMTAELDNGPVICREMVEKYEWDTSLTLYERVVAKELELIESNLVEIMEGNYVPYIPKEEGNLFLKTDFNKLRELDLSTTGTFQEFVDLLRALNHGVYKNAYFETKNGERIFLKLVLEKEIEDR